MSVKQPPSTRPHLTGPLTAGIDWASTDHAVALVDADGQAVDRFTVPHDRAGLSGLVRRLLAAGITGVGIERGDGPVIEALLQAELTVFVIPPSQVKALRSRYGSAGNKDDRFDAFVLADVVRTDARRLRPLVRDTHATLALRSSVRARRDLVVARVAAANQLRAHLSIVFPGAVGLFRDLDSPVSLTWLERFTTQTQADWLSPKRWTAWLRAVGYCGRTSPEVFHARLSGAPRGLLTGMDTGAVTTAFVAVLRTLGAQIDALEQRIAEQLSLHPDEHVFTSLPRSGMVRAARLLAEIGDARGRFPTADALACLAGVAPSTRASGKVRAVTFRWSADKQLRDAVCDFAGDSRHANPWAAHLYDQAIARGHDHPHAVRILARAWIYIIWRCWQDGVAYDPTHHRALQRLNQQNHATAA